MRTSLSQTRGFIPPALTNEVVLGAGFVDWRDEAALQQVQDTWTDLVQGIVDEIDPPRKPYFALNTANEWEQVTPTFTPQLWSATWGPVPPDKETAETVLSDQLARAPRLIPLRYNCCLPAEPTAGGNPVYSIRYTDIVRYGNDLADYLYLEFGVPRPAWAATERKEIPFWSELMRLNGG